MSGLGQSSSRGHTTRLRIVGLVELLLLIRGSFGRRGLSH